MRLTFFYRDNKLHTYTKKYIPMTVLCPRKASFVLRISAVLRQVTGRTGSSEAGMFLYEGRRREEVNGEG